MLDPREALTTYWGLASASLTPLAGGMNSQTWLVEHEGARYVAKSVSGDALADLVAGAEAATALAEAGFVTGRPVPTHDGSIVARAARLALLEHVPGRELDGGTEDEQRWIASTLAGVHAAGGPVRSGPSTSTFAVDWLSPAMPGVSDHRWLADAIDAVREETDGLSLTWSLLHTDPVPEAFIHDDGTGVTGLIDWAGARRGPVLYDVASAVMYLGGRRHASPFLSAYRAEGPWADELTHLDAFSRFREAVQGAYFAVRLATDDLTGVSARADNEKGLGDARRRLAALGP